MHESTPNTQTLETNKIKQQERRRKLGKSTLAVAGAFIAGTGGVAGFNHLINEASANHDPAEAVAQAEHAMNALEVSDLYAFELTSAEPGATLTMSETYKIPTVSYTIEKALQDDYARLLAGDANVPQDMLHYISRNNEATPEIKDKLINENIREVWYGAEGLIVNVSANGEPVPPADGNAFKQYEQMPGQTEKPVLEQLQLTAPLDYGDGEIVLDIDWAMAQPYVIAEEGGPIQRTEGIENAFLKHDIATITATVENGEIVDLQTN